MIWADMENLRSNEKNDCQPSRRCKVDAITQADNPRRLLVFPNFLIPFLVRAGAMCASRSGQYGLLAGIALAIIAVVNELGTKLQHQIHFN